jgi:transcriptional antiterminator NusG
MDESARKLGNEGNEDVEVGKDVVVSSEPWKLVYCASRQEKKVSAYLAQRDIEHYLPLVKSLRLWKDRKKWVEMPLFNGYLFVRPSEIQRDMVLTVSGVVKYIRYNGKDALVPAEQVQLIQRLIEKGYQMERYDGDEDLERGDIAEVLDGVFRGQEVEVFHNTEREESYILVTLDAANHRIKITLPRDILKLKVKGKNRKNSVLR